MMFLFMVFVFLILHLLSICNIHVYVNQLKSVKVYIFIEIYFFTYWYICCCHCTLILLLSEHCPLIIKVLCEKMCLWTCALFRYSHLHCLIRVFAGDCMGMLVFQFFLFLFLKSGKAQMNGCFCKGGNSEMCLLLLQMEVYFKRKEFALWPLGADSTILKTPFKLSLWYRKSQELSSCENMAKYYILPCFHKKTTLVTLIYQVYPCT